VISGSLADNAFLRIKRLPHDLLAHPEKQRIIDVVGLLKQWQSRKRKTAEENSQGLSFICSISSSCGFDAQCDQKNQ